uniref:Uncharacterized protein n=1 Tax=Glossina brevipalpis TaxID=37001 RepID=A0A1A9W0L0_9MUSC
MLSSDFSDVDTDEKNQRNEHILFWGPSLRLLDAQIYCGMSTTRPEYWLRCKSPISTTRALNSNGKGCVYQILSSSFIHSISDSTTCDDEESSTPISSASFTNSSSWTNSILRLIIASIGKTPWPFARKTISSPSLTTIFKSLMNSSLNPKRPSILTVIFSKGGIRTLLSICGNTKLARTVKRFVSTLFGSIKSVIFGFIDMYSSSVLQIIKPKFNSSLQMSGSKRSGIPFTVRLIDNAFPSFINIYVSNMQSRKAIFFAIALTQSLCLTYLRILRHCT